MPSSPVAHQRVVLSTIPNATLYASCPPEDIRDSEHPSTYDASSIAVHRRSSTDYPDATPSLSSATTHSQYPDNEFDPDHTPDSAPEQQLPTKDHDALSLRAIPSSAGQPHHDTSPEHRYDFGRIWENYPYLTNTRPPLITSSFLRPGSKFQGTQESDRQVYNVQVEVKYVDMAESFVCGYLRIQGLTDDHPTLTTYFEGEIIGPRYKFVTAHPEWGSSEKVDLAHWGRFPEWRPLQAQAKSQPNFSLNSFAQREHLFMRWKEYFLVPDHRVKTITGASFEGFYYICFNQCTGTVSGIYFHAKSEK